MPLASSKLSAALLAAAVTGCLALSGQHAASSGAVDMVAGHATAHPGQGEIVSGQASSRAVGEPISYRVYLPDGYAESAERYATLYLLHGRGDTMAAWTRVKDELDELIAQGAIPPVIVVMPDAPWSNRGSWYVDSRYEGEELPGRRVETALTRDLVKHVDETYRTVPNRYARAVGGYSMGGYGALRYVLAKPETFTAAMVLSPAVYVPQPPRDSSARDFGAFGKHEKRFRKKIYRNLNYPNLLRSFDPDLPVHLFIAVGDDEYANPDPDEAVHDIDFESARLYNRARRVPGVTAELRIMDGGHDWSVWQPSFVEGIQDLMGYVHTVPPAELPGWQFGTSGDDRAGGIGPLASGDVAVAAGVAGPLGGQTPAGGLDLVVTRRAPDGAIRWTTVLGAAADDRPYGLVTDTDGEIYTAGYTAGDFDGKHPDNGADDVAVARLGADGTVDWRLQFGDPQQADRAYSVVAAPGGGVYLAGYTKGSIDESANRGDKDAFLARVSAAGEVLWSRQLGGSGEDKALAVAVGSGGDVVYVGGMATAALPSGEAHGGVDGWVASYLPDGTRRWVRQVGTGEDDQVTGMAPGPSGGVVAVGWTGGTMGTSSAGGNDVVTMSFDAHGSAGWVTQSGSSADDRAADVVVDSGGRIRVAGYSEGQFAGTNAGGFDIATLRLSATGEELDRAQFGTRQADGADSWAEENLYLSLDRGALWLSGLTYGAAAGAQSAGSGDVFATSLRSALDTSK